MSAADISIVIPTYGRESVLVDTISALLRLCVRAAEIIVLDQTPRHDTATAAALSSWEAGGEIRRYCFAPPSIPRAMNLGLLAAKTRFVLFLDDDIIPSESLVEGFVQAFGSMSPDTVCLAGQVLQPGESVIDRRNWQHPWFPFNSGSALYIDDVMAGNLCVDREAALRIGGFDENFRGAALKFESEFARRVLQAGGKILFWPNASLRHLRAARGGTRARGTQLTTWRAHHSVGKYYHAFLGGLWPTVSAIVVSPIRAIRTRHHLRRPWWIPATLLAEILGLAWAAWLRLGGPRHVSKTDTSPLRN